MVTQLALLLIGVLSCAGEAFVVETLKLMMQTETETDRKKGEERPGKREQERTGLYCRYRGSIHDIAKAEIKQGKEVKNPLICVIIDARFQEDNLVQCR